MMSLRTVASTAFELRSQVDLLIDSVAELAGAVLPQRFKLHALGTNRAILNKK
jgi:hypothetical protein